MIQFNENTDDQIKMIFKDYKQLHKLTIENKLVYEEKLIHETSYIKNISKYRKAKVVKLNLGESNGINLGTSGKTLTSIEILQNITDIVENFYKQIPKEYETNYHIDTDWKGLELTFILLGDQPKNEESQTDLINNYLLKIQKLLKKNGHKRSKLTGNWLDISFPKNNDTSWALHQKLNKIDLGQYTIHHTRNLIDIELINIKNDALKNNLRFYISGGDQQVVLKFVKII